MNPEVVSLGSASTQVLSPVEQGPRRRVMVPRSRNPETTSPTCYARYGFTPRRHPARISSLHRLLPSPTEQVSRMLGVKQPTADVAAVLLKYGVAAEHFCYARFLKLSRCAQPSQLYTRSPTVSGVRGTPQHERILLLAQYLDMLGMCFHGIFSTTLRRLRLFRRCSPKSSSFTGMGVFANSFRVPPFLWFWR